MVTAINNINCALIKRILLCFSELFIPQICKYIRSGIMCNNEIWIYQQTCNQFPCGC